MKASELFPELKTKLDATSTSELAAAIGYSTVRIHQLQDSDLTPKAVAEIVKRTRDKTASSVEIRPIVEMFPFWRDGSERQFLDPKAEDHNRLRKALDSTGGIYSFYNSEFETIYVGRTKKRSLFAEITDVLTRHMPHYSRYRVHHPHDKFRATTTGTVRRMTSHKVSLYEASTHFSAYGMSQEVAQVFEAIIIRMIPNDLLNVRMEGQSLPMYAFSGEEG